MYLSPSAFMLFRTDPKAFYMRYYADPKPPREPPTPAMCVGSVFDVLVKNSLSRDLGHSQLWDYPDDVPDEAVEAGHHVHKQYQQSGAYERVYDILEAASAVQMEVKTVFSFDNGCKIGGYPDLAYISKAGVPVVLDFKVNGYFSNTPKSPDKGWLFLRSQKDSKWETKQYHKDVIPLQVGDLVVNGAYSFEESHVEWAIQLCFYAWCLGFDTFVAQIEQVACNAKTSPPTLRFATHSCIISDSYKQELKDEIFALSEKVKEGWFFPEMTKEDSENLCRLLDRRCAGKELPDSYTIHEDFDESTD